MSNLDCQPEWVYCHLRDKPLDASVRTFLDEFDWGMENRPECRQNHSVVWHLSLKRRRKGNSTALISDLGVRMYSCHYAFATMMHSPLKLWTKQTTLSWAVLSGNFGQQWEKQIVQGHQWHCATSLTGGMNLDECSLKMRHPEVYCNNQLYSETIYIPRVKPGHMN